MATIKGQRITRRRLLQYLKGREITELLIRVDTIEDTPKDGYRVWTQTGRVFFDLVTERKAAPRKV